jgi:hypothetical protein
LTTLDRINPFKGIYNLEGEERDEEEEENYFISANITNLDLKWKPIHLC